MIRKMLRHLSGTPSQRTPLRSKTPQVRNSAGGYVWKADPWGRLDRFLILGSSEGSYYARGRELTLDNAAVILQLLTLDGVRVVDRIVEISTTGRAPKNDPAIFALAIALKRGDLATRRAASAAVGKVCRIGTHLFQLAAAVDALGGWGRGTQRAFSRWYTERSHGEVAYQALKYAQREGWSHRDVLRKAHTKPPDAGYDALFRWITRGWDEAGDALVDVDGGLRIAAAQELRGTQDVDKAVDLIQSWRLPREVVPTELLREPDIWRALLYGGGKPMPMTAMLRNLATMTRIGVLAPMSAESRYVADRLADGETLRKARIHPLAVLVAMETYKSGRSVRGSATWSPDRRIVDALDAAFYASFGNVRSTGKRWLLALDVSGSMSGPVIAGMPGITPRVASAAMAMVTARSESDYETVAFSTTLKRMTVSPRQRLDTVLRTVDRLPMGGTDCAQPMVWAEKHKVPVDAFVVYTDSETWHGRLHPAAALRSYRRAMGIDAKLIVVGMVSNGFTIADPDDTGMLDVVGFDLAAPNVMADFVSR